MKDGILFIILLAITVATVGAMFVQMIFSFMDRKKRTLAQRLAAGRGVDETDSVYGPIASAATDGQSDSLGDMAALQGFSKKLKRAYPDLIMARFFILVFGIAGFAFFVTFIGIQSVIMGVIVAALAATIPFMVVNAKCSRRLRLIDDQLPEALDFLCRVLRAGHSLTTGLQMAAEEIPEPLASEFRHCYDRHSLGTPLEESLREMAEHVSTSDFAFFVTAVLIQRQTGGDLAEVLGKIGDMVRARIRLQQHVKAITAQGRMVGYILLVLPIVFFFILYGLNPKYASILLKEREGLYVLGTAVFLQVLGVISIRKIVNVRM